MSIRLVNEPLSILLEDIDTKFNILVIESKTLLSKTIQDFYSQLNDEYGDFVLSVEDKPITIKNNLELIINPFTLDINNRKILAAIQKLAVEEAVNESNYIETNSVLTILENYAQKIAYSFNGNIVPKSEITSEALIKMISYQVDTYCTSFIGNIYEYLLNSKRYLKTKVFCFVNLFNYIENSQIAELIKSCMDYEIPVFFIEASDLDFNSIHCKKTIIDADLCHI